MSKVRSIPCSFEGEELAMYAATGDETTGAAAAGQGVGLVAGLRAEVEHLREIERSLKRNSCPCMHTTPCRPRCTCVVPTSSEGCSRCCTYGSTEQQKMNAERLAVADRAEKRVSELETGGVGLVEALEQATQEFDPGTGYFVDAEDAIRIAAPYEARLLAAEKRVSELEAFKAFVHRRLDTAGVPTHPDGPHSREGCRIGDRLDIVIEGRSDALDLVTKTTLERDAALLGLKQTVKERDQARERVQSLQAALEAAQAVLWMAREYAEAGGSNGPEMRDFEEASRIIALAKGEEAL